MTYTLEDRQVIEQGLKAGLSVRRIAEKINRNHSGVEKEISRNGGREKYTSTAAHEKYSQMMSTRGKAIAKTRVKTVRGPAMFKEQIISMFQDNRTIKSIAKEFGLDRNSVSRSLRKWGVNNIPPTPTFSNPIEQIIYKLNEIIKQLESLNV